MESKRLIIRAFQEEDATRLYELAKDSDVGIHAGWPPHKSIEDSKAIIKSILKQDNNFALVEKESGLLIGSCGLQKDPLRNNPLALMLGYWVGKEYWGKGYTLEAAQEIMNDGFKRLGIQLISVYCYEYNLRSQRVIEKLGFRKEGLLRQAVLRFNGDIIDELVYSMTKSEFYHINH